MDIIHLDQAVQHYCLLGLAPSTTRVYKAAEKRFSAFCVQYNITQPFPVTELLLCRFVASMAREGLAPNTLKTYLAGIRHVQILRGLPEPSQAGRMPRLKLLQAGVNRERATSGPPARPRLPITLPLLGDILRVWALPPGDQPPHDLAMLRAAVCVCFFGFFRSGEITVPSESAFDGRIHLAWGDVAVNDTPPSSVMRFHLKRSKCDQFGKGVDVFLGRTNAGVCPVSETLRYVGRRGPAPGPFFIFENGTPLTKAAFILRVREALVTLGLNCQDYAGHSFRIGAATTAAQAGLEDSVIRSLGRWNSDAFLRYIRTPREQLATYSRLLSRAHCGAGVR